MNCDNSFGMRCRWCHIVPEACRSQTEASVFCSERHRVQKKLLVFVSFMIISQCIFLPLLKAQELQGSRVEVKSALIKAPQSISVAAGVQGILERVLVQEGDDVHVDSMIAKVRSDDAENQVKRAKLSLEIATLKANRKVDLLFAKKSADVASQELARTLKANEIAPDTYPANEVDRYKLLAEKADLEVERAIVDEQMNGLSRDLMAFELEKAARFLDRHSIRSPSDALVIDVLQNVGEWVEPSDPVVEIISTRTLRIEGLIDSELARRVSRGMKAEVRFHKEDRQFQNAKLVFVSPTENPVNNQVKLHLELDNSQNLFRPGMSVQVVLIVP